MNIRLTIRDKGLDCKFIDEAASQGMVNFKGGIRVSTYNSQSYENMMEVILNCNFY